MRPRIKRNVALLVENHKVDLNQEINKTPTKLDKLRDPKIKSGVWYTKVFGRTLVIQEKDINQYVEMGFDVFQNK